MNEHITELNEAVKNRNHELIKNCGKVAAVLAVGIVVSGICVLASQKLKYLLL